MPRKPYKTLRRMVKKRLEQRLKILQACQEEAQKEHEKRSEAMRQDGIREAFTAPIEPFKWLMMIEDSFEVEGQKEIRAFPKLW